MVTEQNNGQFVDSSEFRKLLFPRLKEVPGNK